MRAVRFTKTGEGPPARIVERPDPPAPRGTELLVRVAGSSINGSDLGLLGAGGVAGLVLRRSRPGFDIAGTVVACGERVTAFRPGDRVMALLDHGGGGQADLVRVPQNRAATVPDAIPDVAASALPLAGLTALQALRGRGRVRAGQRVLVIGAVGGIGSFAVQLAALLGARVTAVGRPERHDHLREMGAERTAERTDGSAAGYGTGFDLVLDVPGTLRFRDLRGSLADGGVVVSTRPVTPDIARGMPLVGPDRRGRQFTAVTTSASSQDLAFLARLVTDGVLRLPVDEIRPAERVNDAYRRALRGGVRGKLVIAFTDE